MEIFSPVHQVSLPSLHQVWVKRDDLIDPYISGNKWRKLKYIIASAKNAKKNHIVTFGGAYSNHLVATAAAAARNDLKSTAFVRGEEVKNEMLLLAKLFGMQLIFTDRERYRNKRLLFDEKFGHDHNAYFIDEGGASIEAVEGCSEIIAELTSIFTHIFCAAGTGTTAAGLLKGLIEHQSTTQLHVVPVLKGGVFIGSEIEKYHQDVKNLILHTEYHFGGYGKTTPELLTFIKTFTHKTGLLIDPIYTGKLFYAVDDLYRRGYFNKNDKILVLHTGGLLGLLGMKEKLDLI